MIKFLSPWLIPAMCMLCIMFALAVSRAYWLYRFLPLFLPHGRLQPCAVKISNTMKFSKAAQISIDYHKTHSKKKYSAIIPGHHRAVYPGIWWLPHRPGHPGTHPYLSEPPLLEARTVSYGHLPSHEIHGLNAVGPFVQRHDFDVTQIALDGIITCSSRSPRGTAWRFRIP